MAERAEPIIKICGLRDVEVALAAIEAGATALGFMLAESKRQVTPEAAAAMLAELPESRPPAVGVVVNLTPGDIDDVAERTGIDAVQLSGDESEKILGDISLKVWKVFRFAAGTSSDDAARAIDPWMSHARPPSVVMVDAAVAGRYGGTGHRADWGMAADLARRFPLVLAGGLDPENVAGAIATVGPLGVDVSSGVEVDGRKDAARIRAFVAHSRRSFRMPPRSVVEIEGR